MIYIGIDVSKATLDVACLDATGQTLAEAQVANRPSDLRGLLRRWKREGHDPRQALFCLEPTGPYGLSAIGLLLQAGHRVWLAHPTAIKQSLGLQRGKSDRIDARRIAEYAFRFRDKASLLGPEFLRFQDLQALLSARQQAVRLAATLRVRISEWAKRMGKTVRGPIIRTLQRQLAEAKRSIQELDRTLIELIERDETLSRPYRLAQTLPGIGPVTAATLLVITRAFTRFDNPRQLVCYAGLAPFEHRSGTSVRGQTRTSGIANRHLRSLLHLASLNAKRRPGDLRDYYERKIAEGKKPIVALTALAAKLLHHLDAVIRNRKPYRAFLELP